MKHSNPAMRKPSLGKVNFDLQASNKLDIKDKDPYVMVCQSCGHQWVFHLADYPDRVITCPRCHHEELFFKANFKFESFANYGVEDEQGLIEKYGTKND